MNVNNHDKIKSSEDYLRWLFYGLPHKDGMPQIPESPQTLHCGDLPQFLRFEMFPLPPPPLPNPANTDRVFNATLCIFIVQKSLILKFSIHCIYIFFYYLQVKGLKKDEKV